MAWQTGLEHFVRADEPLASRCWLRTGGPAEFFAEPTSRYELQTLVERARDEDLPVRLIGGGSNVLIREAGVKGVTVRLDAPDFANITVEGNSVTAGGGASLSHVITTAVREGLAGMEPLVGIPGTIGGALHGNSGDQVTDVGDWVHSVTVLTRGGEMVTHQREDMTFSYRNSSVDELAIVEATFQLEPEDRNELTRRMQKNWIVKRSQQPTGERPAGCLFKDPLGMTAAELIEQAGLKGTAEGGAALFDRDSNFVIMSDDASSDDVVRLIDTIREKVTTQLGVDLENAIQIW